MASQLQTPPSSSDYPADFCSTGYLEDALIEFSIRFKRRRLLPLCSSSSSSSSSASSSHISCDFNFWAENSSFDACKVEEIGQTTNNNYSQCLCVSDYDTRYGNLEGEDVSTVKGVENEEMMSITSLSTTTTTKRKRSMSTRRQLVYPFGMVKPGGLNGDLTLDDINKSIMKPPTRPVRHPVGDYACPPAVLSFHGPGLSGRAVVALTRIHTQGTGSVTIVRTKG